MQHSCNEFQLGLVKNRMQSIKKLLEIGSDAMTAEFPALRNENLVEMDNRVAMEKLGSLYRQI